MSRTRASVLILAIAAALSSIAPFTGAASSRSAAVEGASSSKAPTSTDPLDVALPAMHIFRDKDGLPQNAAMAMAYDSRQYLWIATQDGLAVYNGRSWTVKDLPDRTISNFVRALVIASDGSVWCGRENGGIARLKDGRWTTFGEADGIPAGRVSCLLETEGADGSPVIWAGVRSGVARFESGAWRVFAESDGLSDPITALREVEIGGRRSVWAGGRGGVLTFDGNGWAPVQTPVDVDDVSTIYESRTDGAPVVWLGLRGGRLARFDGVEWSVRVSPADDSITCIAETLGSNGRRALWAGTDGGGLLRWQDGVWTTLDTQTGMASNSVWSLLPVNGPSGTTMLWVGTDGGAARLELGRWSTFDTSTGLPTNSVYAICETFDDQGLHAMWMGTRGGGLARVRGGTFRTFTTRDGLPNDTVFGLIWAFNDDGSRTLWAGTPGGGLARFENERWIPVVVPGLKDGTIRSFAETVGADGKREVWGATGGGLIVNRGGVWRMAEISAGLPTPAVFSVASAPAPGGKRALWVGLQNGGVARYLDGAWRIWNTENSNFPNDSVLSLLVSKDERDRDVVWAGTEGAGAARLLVDEPDARWEVISDSTPVSLPNNTVYQIREDDRHRLYFFTNRGVAQMTNPTASDPANAGEYVFQTEDGLPSNEFNGGASFVDSKGRIWGGTPAGATVFDPNGEVADDASKPLYVEASQLADGSRTIAAGDRLRYNENNLSFEYALLSYFRERDTRYRTQLEGLDDVAGPWVADYKTSYTTLPAGTYTFRVWAKDYAGHQFGPVEIPFEIRPAPWHAWWAYLIYLALLAGATYVLIRYRLRTLQKRNLELEELVDDRTAQLAEKISQLEVSERTAQEAKEEALDANKAKSVFLSNMSHELRTPLNAVLGFAQLMEREPDLGIEQRENLGIIMRSGEHLLGLITDVLSISKIEAGRLTLNAQPFHLARLLQSVEEMISVRAAAKHLHLVFEVAPDLPRFVRGDEGKLRQVLINLLGNAVKFTDDGGVSLRARYENGRAYFEVEDTGPGIAEDEIASIFDAFVQSDSGRSAKEGTGLGLAISRDFVALMGGAIRVDSEVGRGTVFRFDAELPVAVPSELPRIPRRVVGLEPSERAYRVLVADDRWENRMLLVKLLRSTGFDVHEAADGREAVDEWQRWRPELIWMDMRMPIMSGDVATREIRRREGDGEHCTIIALTASAFEHERGTVLRAGCDDFVTKPYRETTIFEKMTQYLGARFRSEERDDEEASSSRGSLPMAERLGLIPKDLVSELHAALTQGNVKEAQFAVDNIAQHDDALADDLRRLVRGYQFDEILDTIEAHHLA